MKTIRMKLKQLYFKSWNQNG